MDDKADKPKRRWPTYLAIVLVMVVIGYLLSAGPADVIAYKLNNEAFNIAGREFYARCCLWPTIQQCLAYLMVISTFAIV